MREIKFRIWDGKQMQEVDVIDFDGSRSMDYYNFYDGYAGETYSFERHPLMQYTGLKDKNGEEIYEGDIVMFLDRDWIDYEADTKRLPVVYENDAFVLRDTKPDRYGEFFSYSLFKDYGRDRFEVIGNIYKTPELLHETKP